MKQIANRLLSGLALVGWVWQAGAITSDGGGNPYQTVVDRNAFGLKPVPVVSSEPPAPPPPPPNQLKLQGFSNLFGKRRVLLKVTEPPKPGQPPKEEALVLDEGERRGAIEILAIDIEARTVKLSNSGQVTNLALVDYIAKTSAPTPGAPVPGAIPGVPRPQLPMPGIPMPQAPTARPVSSYSSGATLPTMPSRPMRTGLTTGMQSGSANFSAANQAQQSPLSPAEQIVLMEVERERTKAQVEAGLMPPLPPTELTPPGATGTAPPTPGQ